ncbi:myeloid leukemia factor family [Trichomonas vaginalis G3]|uniref:myeloid leukemia factor family n=1 Tax=Trichomonas vaginalis (strain ATCC PRA-98 / G3) TaxID=412133 RepID=UPI0021E5B066|nr:myeloid leukemia factor family [Trichomonas vaginalis G3]KAI5530026.1 myeloid leukemia factor family [Trichomonas vaginalis G3]
MFDIFEHPLYYRRVPTFFQVAQAIRRQRMLEDLMFSDFEVPEIYFYVKSNEAKHNNKKNKKSKAQKKSTEAQEHDEEDESTTVESPKEEQPKTEESPKVESSQAPVAETTVDEKANTESQNTNESEKHEEVEKQTENKEEEAKSEEIPIHVESPKISHSFSEDIPRLEEPEGHSIKHSSSEELPKLEENEKEEKTEEKPKEIIEKKPEELVPIDDDDNYTCETRTVTKRGGFKHVIKTERNEETGVIIVTETREIGTKSMTLKGVIYPDGDVEEFESKNDLNDNDLEEFKSNWCKAFPSK